MKGMFMVWQAMSPKGAAAEIPPAAPRERMIPVGEGAKRGRADPHVPLQPCRPALPGAAGPLAPDSADCSRRGLLSAPHHAGPQGGGRLAPLLTAVSWLPIPWPPRSRGPGPPGRLGLVDAVRQGLLHEAVLLHFHRQRRGRGVRVVGRAGRSRRRRSCPFRPASCGNRCTSWPSRRRSAAPCRLWYPRRKSPPCRRSSPHRKSRCPPCRPRRWRPWQSAHWANGSPWPECRRPPRSRSPWPRWFAEIDDGCCALAMEVDSW